MLFRWLYRADLVSLHKAMGADVTTTMAVVSHWRSDSNGPTG